jgi:hypothetical protein
MKFKAWEDMSPMEKMWASYSDLHKDVFGMRPDYTEVDTWSDEQMTVEYNKLLELLD